MQNYFYFKYWSKYYVLICKKGRDLELKHYKILKKYTNMQKNIIDTYSFTLYVFHL